MNLARKWRSKQFREVIGQQLVVRLIKNSLYRNIFSPVYLFSGTKGCGKTTTARLFAAAINCDALEAFQKNPQQIELPCLTCPSCVQMSSLQHPDFVEIDAASHTGVDNIRQIIEAASFVPVLGRKKIYLIDEAHMLSKAAFNALLKILEEPPLSAMFMLATTDLHKIIDTVISRSFQLFFQPLAPADLQSRLAYICEQERISYTPEGLSAVAYHVEGSARDALNVIERVRLIHPVITKEAVYTVLGYVSDEHIAQIFDAIVSGSVQHLLQLLQAVSGPGQAVIIWKRLGELLQTLLYARYNIAIDVSAALHERIPQYLKKCSEKQTIALLEMCASYETVLIKSTQPQWVLSSLLIKMATMCRPQYVVDIPSQGNDPLPSQQAPQGSMPGASEDEEPWELTLEALKQSCDQLVYSVFKQAVLEHSQTAIIIRLPQQLYLFQEVLDVHKGKWEQIIKQYWGADKTIELSFTHLNVPAPMQPVKPAPLVQEKPTQQRTRTAVSATVVTEPKPVYQAAASISSEKVQMVLKIFPGKVSVVEHKEYV